MHGPQCIGKKRTGNGEEELERYWPGQRESEEVFRDRQDVSSIYGISICILDRCSVQKLERQGSLIKKTLGPVLSNIGRLSTDKSIITLKLMAIDADEVQLAALWQRIARLTAENEEKDEAIMQLKAEVLDLKQRLVKAMKSHQITLDVMQDRFKDLEEEARHRRKTIAKAIDEVRGLHARTTREEV